MISPSTVAVIGSNSFSGAHCVKALLKRDIRAEAVGRVTG